MSATESLDNHGGERLHDRLLHAAGDRTLRRIGQMTNTHPETVRRYLSGHAPSVDFVSRFAQALGLNLNWILTGRGPMHIAQIKPQALKDANATDLLTNVALAIERLEIKVERLERYTQGLEIMIRDRGRPAAEVQHKPGSGAEREQPAPEERPGHESEDHAAAHQRAGFIADALTQRPRPDAR
ncbi:MAG: helix-turn-helix transcriptional regulator [Phycisphaerales bacterium]